MTRRCCQSRAGVNLNRPAGCCPCRWKVGFLASQLPRALPTRLLLSGGSSDAEAGGSGHSLEDDGLLLVGWWVPEQ